VIRVLSERVPGVLLTVVAYVHKNTVERAVFRDINYKFSHTTKLLTVQVYSSFLESPVAFYNYRSHVVIRALLA
jgi:hypothetical protein